MSYLIPPDWNRAIQDSVLRQVISTDTSLKSIQELAAISEIKSYLRQKYDVDQEFRDVTVYSHTATYGATSRVYLDAEAYSASATYSLNVLTLYQGKVYYCSTAIILAETFTPAHWTLLGAQYDFFAAKYPKDIFNVEAQYKKDDQVWWKNHTYKCLIATKDIDKQTLIQFDATWLLPERNVFPDDQNVGNKFWEDLGEYIIPAGKLLETSPVYFIKGDNRNFQLVAYVLDIAVYNMYKRIPPGIVPDIRIVAYTTAKNWLTKVATGNDVVADITKLQPKQGGRIRFGSKIKQNNSY